jgi:hypothetical protein
LVAEMAARATEVFVRRARELAELERALGRLWQVDGPPAGSQLRVFERTLALLTERAGAAPVLLVLEDLHWADTSTLDLVVFLAHNLHERQVPLLATYRADDLTSAERMRRFADSLRRSARRPCSSWDRSRMTTWQRFSGPAPTPRCRRPRSRTASPLRVDVSIWPVEPRIRPAGVSAPGGLGA